MDLTQSRFLESGIKYGMNELKPEDKMSGAASLGELRAACSRLKLNQLSPADFRGLARRLRRFERQSMVRLAGLGNITLQPLTEYLEAACFCAGIDLMTMSGGFEQYMQELYDPQSDVRRFRPDFVCLALDLRLLDADLYFNCSSWPASRLGERRDGLTQRVGAAVEAVLANTTATCIFFNFPSPPRPRLGVADGKQEGSEFAFYARLNVALADRFRTLPRVQIVDVESLSGGFGKHRAFDSRMFYLAKTPWHESFLPVLAEEVSRHIEAAIGRARKCIVLDLDNTLWGGVLGEDGPHGVRIGIGDPVGEAYYDFQMRIKALRDRGLILGICSKNNPGDVEEIFACREMPLKLSDFAAVETSWDTKNRGLQAIADKLGIGTDSLVFVDDNPAEIALIEQTMPEVATLALPGDPARYCEALDCLHGVDSVSITADDTQKSRQYRERAERESSRQGFEDLRGYLKSLGTRISVWTAEHKDLKRLHELFTKTNQFNSTTRRYTITEIEALLWSHEHDVFAFSARDNFGDLGTIGVCVALRQPTGDVEIPSLVMSCRAIGRGIESAVLKQLKRRYLMQDGETRIVASFKPTRKNEPVRRFLEEKMVRIRDVREEGEVAYVLDADSPADLDTDWIAVDQRIDQ